MPPIDSCIKPGAQTPPKPAARDWSGMGRPWREFRRSRSEIAPQLRAGTRTSSRRTARRRRSGSSAGAVQRSSAASPAGGPQSGTAPGSTDPRTSSSCGRFGTCNTPWSSRATRASNSAFARSSTRTGTDGGAARWRRLGRSSCQMVNAALRPLCVRSRCAGASCGRCSCHGS